MALAAPGLRKLLRAHRRGNVGSRQSHKNMRAIDEALRDLPVEDRLSALLVSIIECNPNALRRLRAFSFFPRPKPVGDHGVRQRMAAHYLHFTQDI